MLIDKKAFYKFRYLWLILSGAVSALPLVIPSLGFMQWISIIPCAIVLYIIADGEKITKKSAYLLGFSFFMSYYAVVFHWFIYMYPMEFAGISKGAALVVVIFATLGVSLVQSLFSSWLFVIFTLFAKSSAAKKYPLLTPLSLPALWVIFEWWQTIGWWGVPWGRLCIGQASYTVTLQSASVFGSYFISFIIVLVNSFMAYAMLKQTRSKLLCLACVGVVVLNTAFGVAYRAIDKDEGEKIRVAAIQGNISSEEKWTSGEEQFLDIFNTHANLTRQAARDGAEIILWSETALPYNFFQNIYGMVNRVSNLARECNVTLFISVFTEGEGASYTDRGNDGLYNSIIKVNPDGTYSDEIYAKQHLVPFGEFVPMENLIMTLIPPLAEIQMLDRELLEGKSSAPMTVENGKVGFGICFDSIYESVMLETVRDGANILFVSTNDSWFGASRGLYMHNTQSALRAIETGRYVVRSANTGVSSIISPYGEVREICYELQEGYAIGDVYMRNSTTVYTVIGNTFVYLCMAFCMFIPIFSAFLSKKTNLKKV